MVQPFLTREMFIMIWIMIFTSLTLYLLGIIKFSHDSEVKHLSVTRFSLCLSNRSLYNLYDTWIMGWSRKFNVWNATRCNV